MGAVKTQPKLLVDQMGTFVVHTLMESDTKGRVIARGEFAKCDEATANGRVYSKALWEREIGRLAKRISERQVFGELDHPMDGKTKLQRVSHILTDLAVQEGKVVGAAEIVDTSNGKDLQALFKAGARVGVSSRGFGSTIPDGKGNEVVAEDYRLMTFDFVADPADETATPDIHVEDKDGTNEEIDMSALTLEALKEKAPALVKQIADDAVKSIGTKIDEQVDAKLKEREAALKTDFTKQLLDRVTEMKEDVREEVRGEMLSDPSVGAAKTVMEKVKKLIAPQVLPADAEEVVAGKDAEIAKLKKQISDLTTERDQIKSNLDELEVVSRKVGHQLYIERKVAKDDHADEIRTRLKDATFDSLEKIDERIEEVRKLIKKESADRAKAKAESMEKDTKIAELQEALQKALVSGQQFGLVAYLERQIASNPHAPKLRKLAESHEFKSEKDVDAFVTGYVKTTKTSEEFNRISGKMSGANKHAASGVITESGDHDTDAVTQPNDVAGVPMDQLAVLVNRRSA